MSGNIVWCSEGETDYGIKGHAFPSDVEGAQFGSFTVRGKNGEMMSVSQNRCPFHAMVLGVPAIEG